MKKRPPCRDCIMRVVGCHSWCPVWLRWKRMHDEMTHDAHEEKRHAEEFARRKRYYFKYLPKK